METVIAGAVGAGELFSYNRENYFFDGYRRMKAAYQMQEMRIKQFELYREDVRELISLSVGKMESYLIVNTLQLGFVVTLLVEGRLKNDADTEWFTFLIVLCAAGAFVYYVLSIWLAIHASIAAHSFGVRLLTQFVRLPVPSKKQIHRAATMSDQYEAENPSTLFRIPFAQQQFQRLDAAMGDTTSDLAAAAANEQNAFQEGPANPVAFLEHVKVFRRLQSNWQCYDAYARVCMSLGTNQLLHAMTYFSLGLLMSGEDMTVPAMLAIVVFTTASRLIAYLDLRLSQRITHTLSLLSLLPPLLSTISVVLEQNSFTFGQVTLRQIVFFLHLVWIVFIVSIASADDVNGVFLPRKWRSVLYIDVFGWLSDNESSGPGGAHSRLPDGLRNMIEAETRHMQKELHGLFQRWSSRDVEDLLGDKMCATLQSVRSLQERFKTIVNGLQSSVVVNPETSADDAAAERTPVWLRLEHIAYDTPVEFFHCLETKQTIWDPPSGDVEISDLPTLSSLLNLLEEQVQLLNDHGPAPGQQTTGTESRQIDDEERFGGAEAVNSSRFISPTDRESGQTFHPTNATAETPSQSFLPPASEGGAPSQSGVVFWHRPGKLPWQTVLHGSLVITIMWIAGFLWSVFIMRHHSRVYANERFVSAAELPLTRIVADGWPHPFSKPVGLACHSHFGMKEDAAAEKSLALLVEKYSVHAIHLNDDYQSPVGRVLSTASLPSSILAACVANAPFLQGRGFAGVTIQCPRKTSVVGVDFGITGATESCSVLFLGVDGRSVLRCPINSTLARPTPDILSLVGGGWRVIAAAVGGSDQRLWAANAKSIALLAPTPGGGIGQLSPIVELSRQAVDDIVHLQDIDGRMLLGLSADGTLRAWSLTTPGPPRRWQLSGVDGVQWAGGFCGLVEATNSNSESAIGSLFFASRATPTSPASLWRSRMPDALLGRATSHRMVDTSTSTDSV
eukprot:TRINITY_DN10858_c0_g1_i1.p1 TRINITY_DN10858_c0_g1~~TRINITY_DN10858_c0_g1_i1.p1  ORF type:complete len:982 (+),score=105.44 TRINITY_DN10858_c0_g1_i1:71-2947(+)